jgi:hypothetical protein
MKPADISLAILVAVIGLLMIGGTVGFDFSAGAFAVLLIAPVSFAIGNLLPRQARPVPMFDCRSGRRCCPGSPGAHDAGLRHAETGFP